MLKIGQLAELVGVTTRTIRHYHRVGLLPEVARTEGGYRCYGLEDAVQLVRVRRLAEMGLSLDEVADALADDEGKDLREILVELEASLAAEESRIRSRRDAIAALLDTGGDLREPAQLAGLLEELAVLFGAEQLGLRRERLVVELLAPEGDGASLDLYQRVLADPELAGGLAELSQRFEALDGLEADDVAVDALVADAAEAGEAVFGLLPDELRQAPGDPQRAELLLEAMTAGMGPAQERCLKLLFDAWREASS